jgi:hypothetical protein
MVNNKKRNSKIKKPEKTQAHRELEIESLMDQFMDFGLPLDHEGVQEFIKAAKDFQINGNSMSGKIGLVGFQRDINYVFSKQPHIESRVILEYNKNM